MAIGKTQLVCKNAAKKLQIATSYCCKQFLTPIRKLQLMSKK